MRWAPTNKSCTTKPQDEKWEEAMFYKNWNLHPVVMSDWSLIATRNSHAKHNQLVFHIPEVRQRRLVHQRHKISSDRRPTNCKYWNLQAVVISNCSLIATRKSHVKHNQSVRRIYRVPEHRQKTVEHQSHEMSSERRTRIAKIATYLL